MAQRLCVYCRRGQTLVGGTRLFGIQKAIRSYPDVEVRFLKGRLKFGGTKNSAPFPSVVVVFRP